MNATLVTIIDLQTHSKLWNGGVAQKKCKILWGLPFVETAAHVILRNETVKG